MVKQLMELSVLHPLNLVWRLSHAVDWFHSNKSILGCRMGEKERRWQVLVLVVSQCQPKMSIFIKSGLQQVSCTKDFPFLKEVTFALFIFSLPMTGFLPYSSWGVKAGAEEPLRCYLVKTQRGRASFVGPFLTAKLALRYTNVAFIHRPNGHTIKGPLWHRIRAVLLDKYACWNGQPPEAAGRELL